MRGVSVSFLFLIKRPGNPGAFCYAAGIAQSSSHGLVAQEQEAATCAHGREP